MSSVSFLASSLVEEFSLCRDSNILLSIVPPSTIKLQQMKDTFYLAVENLYKNLSIKWEFDLLWVKIFLELPK